MTELIKFLGNCPRNVNKDASYAVRSDRGKQVVGLQYRTENGEQWALASKDHASLVEMVNAVKTAAGNPPNGSFYINEYSQVIVPVTNDDNYYLAGEYDGLLSFEFEGVVISGVGQGRGAGETTDDGEHPKADLPQPGDDWFGPHVGIPYVLKAGGADIYFESEPRENVKKKNLLSKAIGAEAATEIAGRIKRTKGFEGGRFYINEWREMFAPVSHGHDLRYVYIGPLGLDEPWFPKPHS